MKYFVFDNGLEFIISKDESFQNEKADICSCIGSLLPEFLDYVKEIIDDDKSHEFILGDKKIIGSFSDCVKRVDEARKGIKKS